MYEFYLLIIIFILDFVLAIYVNFKAEILIYEIRKYPHLDKQAGYPSIDYFWLDLPKMKYSFSLFLFRNKNIPPELNLNNNKYQNIRELSNILFFLEIIKIIVIILVIFINLIWRY